MAALFVLFLVALIVSVQSFNSNGHRMTMSLKDYKEELAKTAAAIAAPGMNKCITNNNNFAFYLSFMLLNM
jgi:hypothetical protein